LLTINNPLIIHSYSCSVARAAKRTLSRLYSVIDNNIEQGIELGTLKKIATDQEAIIGSQAGQENEKEDDA
jgi:hypothetical protein